MVKCQDGHEALQNTWQDEEKGLDKARRHRTRLAMGLPVRGKERYRLAVQEK